MCIAVLVGELFGNGVELEVKNADAKHHGYDDKHNGREQRIASVRCADKSGQLVGCKWVNLA